MAWRLQGGCTGGDRQKGLGGLAPCEPGQLGLGRAPGGPGPARLYFLDSRKAPREAVDKPHMGVPILSPRSAFRCRAGPAHRLPAEPLGASGPLELGVGGRAGGPKCRAGQWGLGLRSTAPRGGRTLWGKQTVAVAAPRLQRTRTHPARQLTGRRGRGWAGCASSLSGTEVTSLPGVPLRWGGETGGAWWQPEGD